MNECKTFAKELIMKQQPSKILIKDLQSLKIIQLLQLIEELSKQLDKKLHSSKKRVKIQLKGGFDSETEAEIDKLTREEAQQMLKELSYEN